MENKEKNKKLHLYKFAYIYRALRSLNRYIQDQTMMKKYNEKHWRTQDELMFNYRDYDKTFNKWCEDFYKKVAGKWYQELDKLEDHDE